jgi:hypothetical protein
MLRRFAACATALVLLSPATIARAEPGHVSLRIECSALDADARAALEARAQAELVSEPLPSGEVEVVCDATSSATLSWTPGGGKRRERRVELTAEMGTIDDTILASLHTLLFEEGSPPAPPPSALPPPPAPPVSPIEQTPSQSASEPPVPSTQPRRIHVAGIGGGDVEVWQGGVNFALGAYTGLSVSPRERWAISVAVAPQWGLGSAAGISAWGLRAVGRIEYALLPQLRIGVGASARTLWVSASAAAPTRLEGTTVGPVLSARYVISFGAVTFAVGLKGEALVRPIVVELAGVEEFRVPSFVAGVTVDGAAP